MPRKKKELIESEKNESEDKLQMDKKKKDTEIEAAETSALEREKETKKEKVKELAKKFAEAIKDDEIKTSKLNLKGEQREEFKELKVRNTLLVPFEKYKETAIYLGTKVIMTYMKDYVYKRRADGIAIIDTNKIDERIALTAKFISKYDAKDILVVCKREAGWHAADLFAKTIGAIAFTRRYPAGIITNASLPEFFEPKLLLIVDPWVDKNALKDALRVGIPIVSLCDTNNYTNNIDIVLPCNNKAKTSIALVFSILASEYVKHRGLKIQVPSYEEFIGN